MTYVLRFRPEVVGDLEDAAQWYDDRRQGLGGEFLDECKLALDRILDRPEQGTVDSNGVRTVKLHRFPYVVHFRIERTTVVVFTIMFGGRDPSALRDRM
jgi:mRNA-degrading endonuclease RelE of RelBE toxin-antitoxin system